ncbi:MAG: hypothetical protein HY868_07500 [Chloroflexi bacterium]|nr:hypothetical protein [Chloroflexota bacterium]
MKRYLFSCFAYIAIAVFVFLPACSSAPAPTSTPAPTLAPTLAPTATATLAPTATLTAIPTPTLTPTITPTPAPDTTAALALARAQIKGFNEKDFTVRAGWLADKRVLVVIQSKTSPDAWVLVPGAKELSQVSTSAGPNREFPLTRFDVQNGRLVGYSSIMGIIDKPGQAAHYGQIGEQSWYFVNWGGKDQWLTVSPINEDIKTADAAGLLDALRRMDPKSRGEPIAIPAYIEQFRPAKEPYVYPDAAKLLETALSSSEVAQIVNHVGLPNLTHMLAGVTIRDLGPCLENKNWVGYQLEQAPDGKGYILVLNVNAVWPREGKNWGGGSNVYSDGGFFPASKGFFLATIIMADREAGLLANGLDPRKNSTAEAAMRKASVDFYAKTMTRPEFARILENFAWQNNPEYVNAIGGTMPGQPAVKYRDRLRYLDEKDKK